MYATDILRNEHEGIKVAISVLDRLAEHQLLPHKHEELAKGFDRIEHER